MSNVMLRGKYDGMIWNYIMSPDDVLAIEQEGDYQIVYLFDGTFLKVNQTMDAAMDRFPCLLRVHRSYAVNMKYVVAYNFNAESKMTILFRNKTSISFSRSKQHHDSFIEEFNLMAHE